MESFDEEYMLASAAHILTLEQNQNAGEESDLVQRPKEQTGEEQKLGCIEPVY